MAGAERARKGAQRRLGKKRGSRNYSLMVDFILRDISGQERGCKGGE